MCQRWINPLFSLCVGGLVVRSAPSACSVFGPARCDRLARRLDVCVCGAPRFVPQPGLLLEVLFQRTEAARRRLRSRSGLAVRPPLLRPFLEARTPFPYAMKTHCVLISLAVSLRASISFLCFFANSTATFFLFTSSCRDLTRVSLMSSLCFLVKQLTTFEDKLQFCPFPSCVHIHPVSSTTFGSLNQESVL